MNPKVADLQDPRQRLDALVSSRLPLGKPDQCPEEVFNRILWHAQKGFDEPFPLWAIAARDDDDRH